MVKKNVRVLHVRIDVAISCTQHLVTGVVTAAISFHLKALPLLCIPCYFEGEEICIYNGGCYRGFPGTLEQATDQRIKRMCGSVLEQATDQRIKCVCGSVLEQATDQRIKRMRGSVLEQATNQRIKHMCGSVLLVIARCTRLLPSFVIPPCSAPCLLSALCSKCFAFSKTSYDVALRCVRALSFFPQFLSSVLYMFQLLPQMMSHVPKLSLLNCALSVGHITACSKLADDARIWKICVTNEVSAAVRKLLSAVYIYSQTLVC